MHIFLRSEEGARTGTEVMDGSATPWILGPELEFPAGAPVALTGAGVHFLTLL